MEWISVKDQLPEEYVHVITFSDKDEEFNIDYVILCPNETDEDDWLWACRLVNDRCSVSHWMPIPKAPK